MFVSLLQKLLLAAIVIIMLLSIVRIYIRSKNVTKTEFTEIFKNTEYLTSWVLVCVFIFTAVFGVLNYAVAKKSVYAVITLNYSEASQAQNSNGTRFNISEITCDDVLERAIQKGAFENINVNDLKSCLTVSPYVQGDVTDKSSYYISTEFLVEYHANKKTQRLNSENVLKLITSAYKEYYIEKYTDNFKPDSGSEKPDFSSMEYMDIVAYLDKEATSVLNYLYGLAKKSPSFVTQNNTTFDSIAGKVFQFKETQIEQNLRSLVLQNGITRNAPDYTDRLSYQNTTTDFDRQKNAASFDICNRAISMYSEEMTRVVLVPTWDESGKYYMGRTKVGIDELSVNASDYSNKVASNEKSIMDNNLIINKIQTAGDNSAARSEADSLISQIDSSIESFTKEAIAAGREYSNYKMNQCIAVSVTGSSFLGELKHVAIFAILTYIALMLLSISKEFPKKS